MCRGLCVKVDGHVREGVGERGHEIFESGKYEEGTSSRWGFRVRSGGGEGGGGGGGGLVINALIMSQVQSVHTHDAQRGPCVVFAP